MPSPIGWRGLVTGASGGLGRYIAKALAASGVDLVLTGRDLVALNAVADTVRAQGRTATVLVADLREPDAVTRLFSESNATAGPIDLLVNNAGVELASAYTRYSETELSQIISLDLLIPLQLIREVLPGLVARRRGHIVNVCSLASLGPLPYGGPIGRGKGRAGSRDPQPARGVRRQRSRVFRPHPGFRHRGRHLCPPPGRRQHSSDDLWDSVRRTRRPGRSPSN
jgi:NAD(P)-dependent dehydrogenase (short-subunit alcohol dehydrogenase family)